jgi:hypothetical protein
MATLASQPSPQMNSSGYPGIGRLAYICVQAILSASAYNPTEPSWLIPILDLANIVLVALRLQNIGVSIWFAVISIIPFINILLMLSCAVLPPGYRYHRRIDRIGGVLIAALAALVTILIALAIFG